MAVFSGKNSITQTDFIVTDSDVDETAIDDLFGGAAVVYSLFIENASSLAHLKIYDAADPTVGTTAPDIILQAVASEQIDWQIVDGISFTNFSYACVQEDGTSGTTAPAGTVKLHSVVR